ncbi:hypothetical protein Ade02nite_90820 [Paractinoplanes deccanensis]|uniref:Segregation and condensation protein B n=1 Tax=Paractinoplanes deccanensis TaxID=113561 RepID=A0ABQ3YKC7_9ACTN|nr:hypothetical protein Ade02nite_90820 [Actinoplanes deccanensis]
MSSEEQPESLAAQAAAWVPPWERAQRSPDRKFQSEAEDEARPERDGVEGPASGHGDDESVGSDRDETDGSGEAEAGGRYWSAATPTSSSGDDGGDDFSGAHPVGSGSGLGDPGAFGDRESAGSGLGDPGAFGDRESAGSGLGGPGVLGDRERAGSGLGGPGVLGDRERAGSGLGGPGALGGLERAESGPVGQGGGASDNRQLGDDGDELEEAGLDSDDDFDPAFEGVNPATEAPALGEAGEDEVAVDAPAGGVGADPVEVSPGPELPLPESIEDAVEAEVQDDDGAPVDAPLPEDGDDAGDVFDAAADDDVSDDGENDLPFADEVPEDAGQDDDDDVSDDDDFAGAGADDDDEPREAAAERSEGAAVAAAVPGQASRQARDGAAAVGGAATRTNDDDLPGLSDDAELAAALEAIMLVVDEPVAEMQLAQILEQPTERVGAMLEDLSARYTAAGHGFDLRRVAGGWRLYTRPEYAAYVERFVLDGQSVRLTQAALETLAVVAYKQPVTRSRISAIRGVNCDGVMRTLVTRGLIEECGTESETGAHLYRTTALFLEKLGLNSVDQLPPLAPFLPDDVEEVLDASG